MAATKPDQVTGVATSITTGSKLRIDWTAPDDRGSSLTSYTIRIESSTPGTFLEDTTNCPGTPVANTYCEIPLSTLQDGTFTGLAQGAAVVVTVAATNAFGTGVASDTAAITGGA
jgi:hypothetical protein